MVTIAFGQVFYFIAFRWNSVTGGDDGLTGWKRQPLDLGFTQHRHPRQRQGVLLLRAAAASRVAVGVMALLLRSPFGRTLLAIRENERRARFLGIPVERHIWLVVRDLLLLRQPRRHALRAAQQLHRSARAALGPVGQLRDHGRAGRHALVLGAADRRRDLRRAAGLRLEPDAELDVVHRPVLRAGRAVLPARRARHDPAEGRDHEPAARCEDVSRAFRQPGRRQRRLARRSSPASCAR